MRSNGLVGSGVGKLAWLGLLMLVTLGLTIPTVTHASTMTQEMWVGNQTITSLVDWTDKTVHVRGQLSLIGQGRLRLEHTRLLFEPELEDTTSIRLEGHAVLEAHHAVLQSGSGKQWNLEAYGNAQVRFEATTATQHSGLRMHQNAAFVAQGGDVEEVQAHDSARLRFTGGSAYIVLNFEKLARAAFTQGELVAGDGLTRTFKVATGTGTAVVELADASIYGWQLDVSDAAAVRVRGGRAIVLALHLNNVRRTFTDNITSTRPNAGTLNFGGGAPAFSYSDTTVVSLNIYAGGTCNLIFLGQTSITEANAFDRALVKFGPRVQLAADLAQTYDDAHMICDGVTLHQSDSGTFPSFTAQGNSQLEIRNVLALPDTHVYAESAGQARITDGSGWHAEMCEAINPLGAGGVYINDVRVAPAN